MREFRNWAKLLVAIRIFLYFLFGGVVVFSDTVTAQPQPSLSFAGAGRPLMCLNVLQPFGFGLSSGPPGSAIYKPDPFQNGGRDIEVMSDERLKTIRLAGFDCVRMAIDVAALMAAPDDATLDRLVSQLTDGIARRVTVGLKVIADIHPFPRGTHPVPSFSDIEIIDGPAGPNFRRLIQVVMRLAGSISARFQPADVALELFNEPPAPSAFLKRASWNTQIEFYWHQVRKVLPYHTIIVAGMGFAGIDGIATNSWSSGIINLRPAKFDKNTGFAFHPYESPTFTHQGSPGFFSHVHGLTFPAANYPGGLKKAEQEFETSVNADTQISADEKLNLIRDFVTIRRHSYSFARYWREFGDKQALTKRLAVITSWANANRLDRRQLMNTEFGVCHNHGSEETAAPNASAIEFIRSTVANSVVAGLGVITIHEMQGSCFAISDDRAPYSFDRSILDALRLN